MKKLAGLFAFIVISIVFLNSCGPSGKITAAAAAEEITAAIDSSNWVFIPNLVSPQYGRSRSVTSDFIVTYNRNKLIVYLPYYGRARVGADVLSGRSPLDFTSQNFTIDTQHPSAGEWNILVTPKDYAEVQSLHFTLFSNGIAGLDIVMNNRSSIRFDGNVATGK